ncbi:hypothetical protein ACFOHK_10285 [Falsigemmobacter intermedius]|nr:hypothetical protein [Falsigemmobacter intermedius]
MTNRLALILLAVIAAGILLDSLLGTGLTRGVLRRLVDLVEWLIFWR